MTGGKKMQKHMKLAVAALLALVIMSGSVYAAGLTEIDGNLMYTDTDGAPVYGDFRKADGKYYYFGTDGNMVKDSLVEDGSGNLYYVGEDGIRAARLWKKLEDPVKGGEYWYYFKPNGRAVESGWITVDGKKYHFTEYHMDSGWFTDEDGSTYYLGLPDDGAAESGWLPYKGNDENNETKMIGWYYFTPETNKMVSGCEKKIGTKWYAFTDDGLMIDGFAVVEDKTATELVYKYKRKYYEPVTGVRANGWRYVEDAEGSGSESQEGWYYFVNGLPYAVGFNTKLVSSQVGVAKIDGDYYAFDTNGKMIKGLVVSENDDPNYKGKYYYFDSDGKMKTGLVQITEEGNADAPASEMMFETRYVSIPDHGMSVTGVRNGKLYDNGVLCAAEKDRFELVTISTGKTYVVNNSGVIKTSGTVTLENGRKMKISFNGENYSWEQVQ